MNAITSKFVFLTCLKSSISKIFSFWTHYVIFKIYFEIQEVQLLKKKHIQGACIQLKARILCVN